MKTSKTQLLLLFLSVLVIVPFLPVLTRALSLDAGCILTGAFYSGTGLTLLALTLLGSLTSKVPKTIVSSTIFLAGFVAGLLLMESQALTVPLQLKCDGLMAISFSSMLVFSIRSANLSDRKNPLLRIKWLRTAAIAFSFAATKALHMLGCPVSEISMTLTMLFVLFLIDGLLVKKIS